MLFRSLPQNSTLESILGDTPKGAVILSFYANWCAPCKSIKPRIAKRAEQEVKGTNEQKPRVIRVNLDHHSELADKFNVFSIPCMVLLKDGRPVAYVQPSDHQSIDEFFMKAEVIGYS